MFAILHTLPAHFSLPSEVRSVWIGFAQGKLRGFAGIFCLQNNRRSISDLQTTFLQQTVSSAPSWRWSGSAAEGEEANLPEGSEREARDVRSYKSTLFFPARALVVPL